MKFPAYGLAETKLNKGKCPDCDADLVDLRGSNASQYTIRNNGRCCTDGWAYDCNKDVRDEKWAKKA
jgi:transposase-like protein